jgi:hypothetical protein
MTTANVGTPVTASGYSTLLIIDTGSNAGWSGGAGVTGTYASDADAIYHFRDAGEMRNFFKAGPWYSNAARLFTPSASSPGVSDVYFISASTTLAPQISIISTADEELVVGVKAEGEWSNGVRVNATGTDYTLSQGYLARLEIGDKDKTKYRVVFETSSFTGLAPDGIPYNEIAVTAVKNEVVLVTPEFSTTQEFKAWAENDATFQAGFSIVTAEDHSFVPADLGTNLATGGSQTYNASDLDKVFLAAKNLNVSFVLADNQGAAAAGTVNTSIAGFARNQRFDCLTFVAAYGTKNDYSKSILAAKYFNSDYVVVTHGNILYPSTATYNNVRTGDALAHCCLVLGRIAGMAPQLPATFKEITVSGLEHKLTDYEKEDALDAGLLVTYYDSDMQAYVILKGINTLQNNSRTVNNDGTTPMIAIRRAAGQVNKELIIDSKRELLSQKNGVTIVTLPESVVVSWASTKLQQKVGRGLISAYQNVAISRQEDAYFVTYEFRPAYEINFIFFTGVIID